MNIFIIILARVEEIREIIFTYEDKSPWVSDSLVRCTRIDEGYCTEY
jgi:hypothetical protein